MKTDAQLKADVEAELAWDPSINANHVGISVTAGVVTLSGHLDTYAEKFAIERAVQQVRGVRAVAIELDVRLAPGHKRSDTEIAEAADRALAWQSELPADTVKVRVENGWITLSGQVDWDFQRRVALRAVRSLTGVLGVSNNLTLKPAATPAEVSGLIRQALERQALDEANRIRVAVSGNKATLSGSVHSWAERAVAQRAAWSAPGVTSVQNDLNVAPL
ncbi:MAG: OsmY domain-containing protein [Variovorax paradoxus]|uniref:OsmY domain-containing protein n=1 Tax=Variovorax paradoxus TaxID=34073 RepID=A0A2W5QFK5_VARPD|nr:MAG: OsmY domain-containing protein [Variovorax paradoxus]